jgi:hypothetical protein
MRILNVPGGEALLNPGIYDLKVRRAGEGFGGKAALGESFDEDDIERIEDEYGR